MCNVDPKSIQNAALGIPGWRPGPPWDLPWASRGGWFSDASKDSWKKWWILGGSRHVLGGPRRPRGSPKIEKISIYCLKRAFQLWFLDDFRTDNRLHVFRVIWHRFFTKKQMEKWWKKHACFHSIACFFEQGDPHETSNFTIRKLLFHFSCCCVFFLKNVEEWLQNSSHFFTPPKHQKVNPRDPFWVPKRSRINVGVSKNP